MDEVNFFAKRMDSLTEYERKVLSANANDYGVGTMQDLINLTFSMKGLSLLTDFTDARQVGVRLYLDEFLGMSEEEKEQTNFIEFAEKTLKESVVRQIKRGCFRQIKTVRREASGKHPVTLLSVYSAHWKKQQTTHAD